MRTAPEKCNTYAKFCNDKETVKSLLTRSKHIKGSKEHLFIMTNTQSALFMFSLLTIKSQNNTLKTFQINPVESENAMPCHTNQGLMVLTFSQFLLAGV